MEMLGDIFEFVSGGGHGSGGGSGGGGGSGSLLGNNCNGNSSHRPGSLIVSDLGPNEVGAEYYGNDQRPQQYRSFDIHREVSSIDAFTIRQSGSSSDTTAPAPTFYSRPLMLTGGQPGHTIESFQLFSDRSLNQMNYRFSAMPTPPDLVSNVQLQREHTSLSMNTMIAQANIFRPPRAMPTAPSAPPQFYDPHYQPLYNNFPQQHQAKGSMMILREGWKRKYRVDIARYRDDGLGPITQVLYWRGPTSPRAILGNKPPSGSELKLVTADYPAKVVAIWKSGNGKQTMGNLTIFEESGFVEEGILTEIMASCLAVTLFERNFSFGLLNWLTK